jgi:hypothetical protein
MLRKAWIINYIVYLSQKIRQITSRVYFTLRKSEFVEFLNYPNKSSADIPNFVSNKVGADLPRYDLDFGSVKMMQLHAAPTKLFDAYFLDCEIWNNRAANK